MVPLSGNMHVSHNGEIILETNVVSQTTCNIYMSEFPFDQQTCKLIFSSWVYGNKTIVLSFVNDTAIINTRFYNKNFAWDLVTTSASRNSEIVGWHDLTFYVVIRRRPGFYVFVLIVPSLLLSVLTPLLFTIPPSRPDRTTLG